MANYFFLRMVMVKFQLQRYNFFNAIKEAVIVLYVKK